ncbi:iron ABC transporter permease [Treponema sp.]|uniref:FecCD family ABC transporter permease n=1 Tax=Treponema sp. TaxID=166 RepID=UPI00298DFB16|nr:iron ABC transporter permease [Treponema sp.]MCR5612371.1 iron ABC transporter permease [Treponema sp.]
MKKNSERFLTVLKVLPLFVLVLLCFFAVCIGTKIISPFDVLSKKCSPTDFLVITKIRVPRILLSVVCGALLGGTGAVFQGLFRNPLADPGIMGVSSGATFGAVISGFFPIAAFSFLSPVSVFAFLGAALSALCVFLFSKIFKETSGVTLLLSGTAVGTFFSAIASIILLMREKDLHSFYAWTTGSFNAKGWNEFLAFIIPSVIAFILLELCARHLDVLVCGEQSAIAFGLDYKKVRNLVLVAGSLASSCAVCAGGIISFVGLIAPHIARKIYGPVHRTLIFESMIYGAILMLVSDTVARTVITPSELPVGIITSLIGVPCFIAALVRMNGGQK